MPDLAEQIRTVIDAGAPSISADEVMERRSQPPALSLGRQAVRPGLGAAISWTVAGAVAIVALVVGVDLATMTPTPSTTRTTQSGQAGQSLTTRSFAVGIDKLTFSYPSDWTARQYLEDQSSFLAAVVFLATQVPGDPCKTTYSSSRGPLQSVACSNFAVRQLAQDGIYLYWSYGGGPPGPGGQSAKSPGADVTVGGEHGTIDIQRPGTCASIGGDESIEVDIGPSSRHWLMLACLRGPDLDRAASQVLAVLKSTRFSPQSVSP